MKSLVTDTMAPMAQRGPYNRPTARPIAERLTERAKPQPACKCGCGVATGWLTSKARWRVYLPGHYRQVAPYKDAAWLRRAYVDERRSVNDIAREFGVSGTTIHKFMARFVIAKRDASESKRGVMVGDKNPAWKGGVAVWDYASDWKVIARQVRNEARWICEWCGRSESRWGRRFHVHHIDQNKLNNERANLVAICWLCHARAHGRGGDAS